MVARTQLNRALRRTLGAALAALLVSSAGAGCVDDVEVGLLSGGPGGAGGTGGILSDASDEAGPDAAPNRDAERDAPEPARCEPQACARFGFRGCGNCQDDDGDGRVDSADPQCLGACDDSEEVYGDSTLDPDPPCEQDCYFEQDRGPGNDGCVWSHRCDVLSTPANGYSPSGLTRCEYDPSATLPTGETCDAMLRQQRPECAKVCGPLVPNGCDCFGCCELVPGQFVFIGSHIGGVGTCDAASLDDRTRCRACTKVDSCFNSCDPCEVCVGRPEPLATCPEPGAGSQCPRGVRRCGYGTTEQCRNGYYCVTGCCVPTPKGPI